MNWLRAMVLMIATSCYGSITDFWKKKSAHVKVKRRKFKDIKLIGREFDSVSCHDTKCIESTGKQLDCHNAKIIKSSIDVVRCHTVEADNLCKFNAIRCHDADMFNSSANKISTFNAHLANCDVVDLEIRNPNGNRERTVVLRDNTSVKSIKFQGEPGIVFVDDSIDTSKINLENGEFKSLSALKMNTLQISISGVFGREAFTVRKENYSIVMIKSAQESSKKLIVHLYNMNIGELIIESDADVHIYGTKVKILKSKLKTCRVFRHTMRPLANSKICHKNQFAGKVSDIHCGF